MRTRHFKQLPKPYLAYPKVIQGFILKKNNKTSSLPDVEYVVDELKINAQHLHDYNAVCGFQDSGIVSATYLAVLSQSLQMHMMTQEDFPFTILGLVHIRNQITQQRDISQKEKLKLSCRFGAIEPHDKGVQFKFITTVHSENEQVLSFEMTYLSRQKQKIAGEIPKLEISLPELTLHETWQVTENIGRRYALVSGDFNLIHLHAVTAKAFGFKKAIAHGMWSNAKAFATLQIQGAYEADIQFKQPMFLPSSVDVMKAEVSGQRYFVLQNTKTQKPHVIATVKSM